MAENNLDFQEIEQDEFEELPHQEDEELKLPQQTAPPQAKKPQTGFSLFIADIREQLKQDLVGLKQTAFLQEAGKRWSALDPAEKQKYMDLAQRQREAYQAQHQGDDDGEDEEQLKSKSTDY